MCDDLCVWNFFIYFINGNSFTKLYEPASASSLDFIGNNPVEWVQKRNWFDLKFKSNSYNPSFKQAVTDIVFNKVMNSFQGVKHDTYNVNVTYYQYCEAIEMLSSDILRMLRTKQPVNNMDLETQFNIVKALRRELPLDDNWNSYSLALLNNILDNLPQSSYSKYYKYFKQELRRTS